MPGSVAGQEGNADVAEPADVKRSGRLAERRVDTNLAVPLEQVVEARSAEYPNLGDRVSGHDVVVSLFLEAPSVESADLPSAELLDLESEEPFEADFDFVAVLDELEPERLSVL